MKICLYLPLFSDDHQGNCWRYTLHTRLGYRTSFPTTKCGCSQQRVLSHSLSEFSFVACILFFIFGFALILFFLGLMCVLQLVVEVVGSRSIQCVCYLPIIMKKMSRIDAYIYKKNLGLLDLLFWLLLLSLPLWLFDYAYAISIQRSIIKGFSLILFP